MRRKGREKNAENFPNLVGVIKPEIHKEQENPSKRNAREKSRHPHPRWFAVLASTGLWPHAPASTWDTPRPRCQWKLVLFVPMGEKLCPPLENQTGLLWNHGGAGPTSLEALRPPLLLVLETSSTGAPLYSGRGSQPHFGWILQ